MKTHKPDPFFDFAKQPDNQIDLATGALLIAQSEYPQLNIDTYLQQLDEMADVVRQRLNGVTLPDHQIAQLNRYLFTEQLFRGDYENYGALDNNFINAVLDRKIGMPITLSIVYIEVGKRAGLPLVGVNFPTHFIVKYKRQYLDIFIDPSQSGMHMSELLLEEKLSENLGKSVELESSMLLEATPREILARMLRNLIRAYTHLEQEDKALQAAQRITWLLPKSAVDLQHFGFLLCKNHAYNDAISTFEKCIELEEDLTEVAMLEENIQLARQFLARFN